MTELTSPQRAQLASALEQRRRELLDEVRDALENTEKQEYAEIVGRAPTDAGDASMSDELADLNLTLLDRHVHALREVEAAQKGMRDGTYGTCPDCGSEIGFERLMAYPTALRCVRCQEAYERTHASQATPTL